MTPSEAEPVAAAVNYFEAPETVAGLPIPGPDDPDWRAIRLAGLSAEARVNFVGLARYAFCSLFASIAACTLPVVIYTWRPRRYYDVVYIDDGFYWISGSSLTLALSCGFVGAALRSRRQWAFRADLALTLGLTLDFAAILAWSSLGSEAFIYPILGVVLVAYWALAVAIRPSKSSPVFTDRYREAVRLTPDLRPIYPAWAKILIGAMTLLALLMWVSAIWSIREFYASLIP